MADRFLIAPYDEKSGLQTNYRPWLIPDEAFAELTNAYVFRGRVRKRFGSRLLSNSSLESRFRVFLGTTDAAGNISVKAPNIGIAPFTPLVTPAVGQMFSIGTQVFTLNDISANPAILLISGTAALATYDLVNSDVVIAGADPFTDLYFYPSLPVMGLQTFNLASINDEKIIGFDTVFAYEYTTGWQRLNNEVTAGASVWTGSNSQFFWTCTWSGTNASDRVFFVTNFNENEPNFMRFFTAGTWDNFRPQVSATDFLNAARILVPFKNRLIALNTWESAVGAPPGNNYVNRCRWSAVGNPLSTSPNSWRQDIPGNGNALDAPTTESIVTVEFIKDRLIVFFERSTWELVWTGNQAYPFAWQQINTELGAESTFSVVPFDKIAIGVGNVGIHACNGANVERIDTKIPDTVFDIHNVNQGVFRVYGVRDYEVEMVYWTFPDTLSNDDFPFPNRVLIYNYKNGTWAFNQDSITVFGYYQPLTSINWDSTTVSWDDAQSWDAGIIQAKQREIIAGNQEGYTFIIDADETKNCSALQITDMTVVANVVTVTAVNHNLRDGEYVYFEGITSSGPGANLNLINGAIFEVISPVAKDTFTFVFSDSLGSNLTGTYTGAGIMARVSQISVKTKEYNFYAKQGRNTYVSKVDFLVDRTAEGEMQVEFFASTAQIPLLQDSAGSGSLLGTGTLETFPYTAANSILGVQAPIEFEATAIRLWHPVYFQAEGEVVQFHLTMNDTQMRDTAIRLEDFQLHAIVIHASATSFRLQ